MYCEEEGGDSMAIQPPGTFFTWREVERTKWKYSALRDEQRRKTWHAEQRRISVALQTAKS